jgi:high-affinity nickel-transport protein
VLALALCNVAVWCWAALALHDSPALLGTAQLAYTLGLRHAVDADHIAAIDNVTRNMVNDGKQSSSIGFVFALGHALIVLAGADHAGWMQAHGAVIGAMVSTTFLILIGTLNLVSIGQLVRVWLATRRSRTDGRTDGVPWRPHHDRPAGGGPMSCLLRPCLRLVRSGWTMFLLGMLFGVGFETASEIAVLGTAGAQASAGAAVQTILLFPCLFAAGMITVDSMDGLLMRAAYGWTLVEPMRKLYYNLAISVVSTTVALSIGIVEAVGLFDAACPLASPFLKRISELNGDFGAIGASIIGLFCVGWLLSMAMHRRQATRPTSPVREAA